jgi:hypothetical protein
MNLTKILKNAFLLIAATWLALAGLIIPILYEQGEAGDQRALNALAHVVILSLISLATIVWFNKPKTQSKGKA